MQTLDIIALAASLLAFATAAWSSSIARDALKAGGPRRLAEVKKEWIEQLRSQIASFLAADARMRFGGLKAKEIAEMAIDHPMANEQFTKGLDIISAAQAEKFAACEMILLLTNDTEPLHQALHASLQKNEALASDTVSNHDEVLAAARAVLRSEWNRLKIEINSNHVTA
jgi:hypothetical protein